MNKRRLGKGGFDSPEIAKLEPPPAYLPRGFKKIVPNLLGQPIIPGLPEDVKGILIGPFSAARKPDCGDCRQCDDESCPLQHPPPEGPTTFSAGDAPEIVRFGTLADLIKYIFKKEQSDDTEEEADEQ